MLLATADGQNQELQHTVTSAGLVDDQLSYYATIIKYKKEAATVMRESLWSL